MLESIKMSPQYLLTLFVLYVLLSPGVLLTIPPGPSGRIVTIGETPLMPVLVHAAVFVAGVYLYKTYA